MEPGHVLLIIAGSLLALGVIFWLVGFAAGRGRRRGWARTMGWWIRGRALLGHSWQVEYVADDGQVRQIMPWMNATSFSPSGPVPITYDPHRPERAVIDTFYHRGGVFLVVGGVVAGMAVVLLVVSLVVL
ncbi:hypothetical protein C8046_12000 [Serinibacter arcticus]|uniref:DUF3592 domain-containing protein n=1 Tax=Serinibacter arcticus TaxID=1655435 RepID=A0A2U1ZWC3_9MICO|nr:hypothetical protein [Serinibacter arcticus]PWD51271.1 hypothetical protein C8046_12000 [Serinibacter arcticus]